jgi:CelD/BcsL family acetyltransferase involved in cellulose biosynthesis
LNARKLGYPSRWYLLHFFSCSADRTTLAVEMPEADAGVKPLSSAPARSRDSVPAELARSEVCDISGIAALKKDYEHLQATTGNVLPFALYEWHLTWCRHFLNIQPAVEDQPRFQVLRDTAGVCVGIIPMIVSRRRVGPLKFASVGLLGADPAITEIRGALMIPGYEQLAARAVRAGLDDMPRWDWVQWIGATHWLAALIPEKHTKPQASPQSYVLDLPPSWDMFRAGLKRNIRESLRHCYNSLKRGGHTFELRIVTETSDVGQALDCFLALHARRADMQGTSVHPNRFASEVSQRFLYDVCSQLAQRGVLRIFQLKVGSEVVAMRIGFVVAGSLYLYYSGYDPAWAKYSVMTTTVAEAIKYAIAQGLNTVNLSPGADVSKTRWGPRVEEYPVVYEYSHRLTSRVAAKVYVAAKYGNGVPSWVAKRLSLARRRWD